MDAQQIKELRLKLKQSQQDFSYTVGVTQGTVNRWERGLAVPSKLAMVKLIEIEKKAG